MLASLEVVFADIFCCWDTANIVGWFSERVHFWIYTFFSYAKMIITDLGFL